MECGSNLCTKCDTWCLLYRGWSADQSSAAYDYVRRLSLPPSFLLSVYSISIYSQDALLDLQNRITNSDASLDGVYECTVTSRFRAVTLPPNTAGTWTGRPPLCIMR